MQKPTEKRLASLVGAAARLLHRLDVCAEALASLLPPDRPIYRHGVLTDPWPHWHLEYYNLKTALEKLNLPDDQDEIEVTAETVHDAVTMALSKGVDPRFILKEVRAMTTEKEYLKFIR